MKNLDMEYNIDYFIINPYNLYLFVCHCYFHHLICTLFNLFNIINFYSFFSLIPFLLNVKPYLFINSALIQLKSSSHFIQIQIIKSLRPLCSFDLFSSSITRIAKNTLFLLQDPYLNSFYSMNQIFIVPNHCFLLCILFTFNFKCTPFLISIFFC